MQALVHCWRKCIANGGDYLEKECFVAKNLLFVSVVVSMEINREHYFRSGPRNSVQPAITSHRPHF